jgi:hypothetical protein
MGALCSHWALRFVVVVESARVKRQISSVLVFSIANQLYATGLIQVVGRVFLVSETCVGGADRHSSSCIEIFTSGTISKLYFMGLTKCGCFCGMGWIPLM